MEEIKNLDLENIQEEEKRSTIDFQAIFRALLLNWKWFILSLIICIGAALIYLRYTTPYYQAHAKFLIKDEDNSNRRNNLQNMANLGIMSNSAGIDNEMEILRSRSLASSAVRDLKLYTTYRSEGKVKDVLMYGNQPISVDIDSAHLELLNRPIRLTITRENNQYRVKGTYYVPTSDKSSTGPYTIDKTFASLPMSIGTRAGILTFNANGGSLVNGSTMKVDIMSPNMMAARYASALAVSQTSKTTTIAQLTIVDEIPQRAIDYLSQLAICYNRQANEDKNEVAIRTEEFINSRLQKINAELGNTEGALESYKRQHGMVELKMNASQAVGSQMEYEQRLAEANMQLAILSEIQAYMNSPENQHQTIPSNVGLSDPSSSSLINKYNELVLERNRMLRSASEENPNVQKLTSQLDNLATSIRRAMNQNRRNMEIQRNSIQSQYGKYSGQVSQTPEQERMLNQIGRQQEVKSSLYIMLLQKREENSISLAATADKGRLLDQPVAGGKVSPKSSMIMLIALLLALGIPSLIIFLVNFFRYKIEGHDDVARLTRLPILADVAIANETAKTKAGIVVHENQNNQMEEIFRSMRTNLQFMLKEHQKVIMFTSSTSGEGKTFNAANISVSFALLGKKAILVGLDIRKPRLAELFEINDHHHGITPLLTMDNPTESDVMAQVLPSGVNDNLDLLLAGPTPPNPTELIARNSLEIIFDVLREKYDYIIIDTAPVGLVTDTLQIGRVADVTVYMCRADYTPKSSFELINSLAAEKKLPNMSIVLNGIDMSKKKYGYYYGYGRYGKYGRYGRYGGKYGKYGSGYGYGSYGSYGLYGNYSNSNYGNKNDTSVKR